MRIAELTNKPLNYESARVANLIPAQLRGDASKFVEFMEDYYAFMNDSVYDGPSEIISRANEQHDLDQIDDQYIENIQSLLAPYIPFNLYGNLITDKRRFFRLLVRYFYTNRGSRESITNFFRIFFNEENVEIIENFDRKILIPSDIVPGDSQSMMNQWGPYSYGIGVGIPIDSWKVPYKALVHPIGWRFFAYVNIFLTNYMNQWERIIPDYFSYSPLSLQTWWILPPNGAHSPTSQPSVFYIPNYIVELTNSIYFSDKTLDKNGFTGSTPDLIIDFSTQENVSHMVLTKYDYVSSLKCYDQTPAILHQYLTFYSTTQPFSYDYVNDFINVSSQVIIT
jgi:hypothetical protein